MLSRCHLNTLDLFAFTRFYLRVLADENKIILRLKQNVILTKAINTKHYAIQRGRKNFVPNTILKGIHIVLNLN